MDLVQQLTEWSGTLAGLLWGNPLTLIILLGTGLYLTIRMGLVQLRGFAHAFGLVSGKYSCKTDAGEVSHFQALSTALSATVGTGNIAGVATAITLGGPGALFWMWVTAVFGMATKFVECTLALQFRHIDSRRQRRRRTDVHPAERAEDAAPGGHVRRLCADRLLRYRQHGAGKLGHGRPALHRAGTGRLPLVYRLLSSPRWSAWSFSAA